MEESIMRGKVLLVATVLAVPIFAGINVKDFGAVGDGVHDDTAALQERLDAGGLVEIPAGSYLISDTLMIHDGTNLRLDFGAVIHLADGACCLMLFFIDLQLLIAFFLCQKESDHAVFPGFPGLAGSKDRPHGRRHGGAVTVFHPGRQTQVKITVVLHGISPGGLHQLRDFLYFVRRHLCPVRKTDDIAFAERISGAERDHDNSPRPHTLLQRGRDPVAKGSVQPSV